MGLLLVSVKKKSMQLDTNQLENMKSVTSVCQRVSHYRPRKLFCRRYLQRCAVNLVLRENPANGLVEVLMIKRAHLPGDPWSGHMAFPGGRRDKIDVSNWHAAKRELFEEVGIDADKSTDYVGRLSDIASTARLIHRPMVITPYVLRATEELRFRPNAEVADTVWVPLAFLNNYYNRDQMVWRKMGVNLKLPCYFYENQRIWGMSLLMLDELLHCLQNSSRKSFYPFKNKSQSANRILR